MPRKRAPDTAPDGAPILEHLGGGMFSRWNARSKERYFFIRFDVPSGQRKQMKVGKSKTEAKELLERIRYEIRTGIYVDPEEEEQQRKLATTTFGEFADQFMKDYGSQKRSDHYEQQLAPMREFFGQKPIREITRADCDRFAVWRKETGKVGPSTLRKNLISLGTVFKKAVRWGILDASPAVDLDMPAEPQHKTRFLSRREWDALLGLADDWTHSLMTAGELKPIWRLALAAGLRLKEVTSLRWEDVDRKAGVLYANPDNKTGRPDPVPLTAEARAVLEDQVRHVRCPYVFVDGEEDPYTSELARNRITKATIAAMKAAGISGASFHTYRHTCASWMVQRNVSLAKVQRFMRHRNHSTTLRYAHLQPEHLGDTVKALDEALSGNRNSAATGQVAGGGAA